MTIKKYSAIYAAAALMLTFTACGSVGSSDPLAITKKNNDSSVSDSSSEVIKGTESSEPDSSPDDSSDADDTNSEGKEEDSVEKTAEKLLAEMSVDEKIGQLFIVRPDALEYDFTADTVNSDEVGGVSWLDDEMKETLDKYPVGGVIMFRKNLTDSEQITAFVKDLQEESEIPLFVGINEEGGSYSSISNTEAFDVKTYEGAAAIGDEKAAKEMGESIGKYLKKYGFNLNFAPVANTLYSDNITSDRIFSDDPKTAGKLACAEIKGMHKNNIMTAAKSFPVSGYTERTMDDLKDTELESFSAVLGDTDMLVVGNATAPNAVTDGLPASLSKEWITDTLRGEMKYNGVVVSGAMSDSLISYNYTSGDSAVAAIKAGADIVLMPYALDESFNAVSAAVENGTISDERLDESVLRILTLKAEYGLIK